MGRGEGCSARDRGRTGDPGRSLELQARARPLRHGPRGRVVVAVHRRLRRPGHHPVAAQPVPRRGPAGGHRAPDRSAGQPRRRVGGTARPAAQAVRATHGRPRDRPDRAAGHLRQQPGLQRDRRPLQPGQRRHPADPQLVARRAAAHHRQAAQRRPRQGPGADQVLRGGPVGKLGAVGATVADVFAGLFIVLFSTYFFLADGNFIWSWLVRLFPRAGRLRADSSGRWPGSR